MWRVPDGSCSASVELPQVVPLKALYLGRFPSTNHSEIFLWAGGFGPDAGAEKRLVLVAVQDKAKPQPAKALQSWVWRNSPFFAPECETKAKQPFRGVCTFDVHLNDIVGLDYMNPLLVGHSRLAIEARKVKRRWFPTLEKCSQHYGWNFVSPSPSECEKRLDFDFHDDVHYHSTSCGSSSSSSSGFQKFDSKPRISKLVSDQYRLISTTAGEGQCPMVELGRVVPRSEILRCSPSKPRRPPAYWQEHSEEKTYQTVNRVFLCAERVSRVLRRRSVMPGFDAGDESDDGSPIVDEDIHCVTVNFRFDDPFLPYVIREVIHDPDHPQLLRLYEAGLPAWAVFLPQYTGLYRRWMRIVVSIISVIISCISVLLGFYDLYKRIPMVRGLLVEVLGPMSATLEELVVVRFSVLLAWILPYQAIFRRCWNGGAFLLSCFRQLSDQGAVMLDFMFSTWSSTLGPIWTGLWLTVSAVFQPVVAVVNMGKSAFEMPWHVFPWVKSLCEPFIAALSIGKATVQMPLQVFSKVLGIIRETFMTLTRLVGNLNAARAEVASGVQSTVSLLKIELTSVRQACMSIYHGTIFWSTKVAKHQVSMRMSFWRFHMKTRRQVQVLKCKSNSRFSIRDAFVFLVIALHISYGNFDDSVFNRWAPPWLLEFSPKVWFSGLCGPFDPADSHFEWIWLAARICPQL